MPNTLAIDGISTPAKLSTTPSILQIRNSGIIATCAGMTSAVSNRRKMRSRPANRSLAKA